MSDTPRQVDQSCVYLWLPNGTYDFTISDGETTLPYHAVVDGEDIEVEPEPLTVPVTPGVPVVFDTAAEASNALGRAELSPSAEIAAMFGGDADAKAAYCAKFGFAVVEISDAQTAYCENFDFAVVEVSGGKWALEAVLTPEAWSNVVESAQAATRQIPVADIAALSLDTPTNVAVKACCVPGFYYSVYAGGTVTSLKALAADKARNVLCGPGRDVEFSGVVKPSAAAGFFTIGVREAPDVQPSDGHRRLPIIVPPVLPQ